MIEPEFNDLSTSGLARGFCTIKQVNYRLYPTYRIQANNYKFCGVTSWFDESSSSLSAKGAISQAGFEHKRRRHRRNYAQNNELQSEVVDVTKYEKQEQLTDNKLFLLHIRFPVIKSLRTNEDTYATLICSPENKYEEESDQSFNESGFYSAGNLSAVKARNDELEQSDDEDIFNTQRQQSESGINLPRNHTGVQNARRPTETGNNLKYDNSDTEPFGEESDRIYQVTVLPPPEMIQRNQTNLYVADQVLSRLSQPAFTGTHNNDDESSHSNGTIQAQILPQTSSNNNGTTSIYNYNDNKMDKSKKFSLSPMKQRPDEGSVVEMKPGKSASDLGESQSFVRHYEERTLSSILSTINKNNQREHVTNCNENSNNNSSSNNDNKRSPCAHIIWPQLSSTKAVQQKSFTLKTTIGNQLSLFLLTFIFFLLVIVLIFVITV